MDSEIVCCEILARTLGALGLLRLFVQFGFLGSVFSVNSVLVRLFRFFAPLKFDARNACLVKESFEPETFHLEESRDTAKTLPRWSLQLTTNLTKDDFNCLKVGFQKEKEYYTMVLQHEHPLSLIDLNPKYPHDEQVYDDEEDLIIKQAFQHLCDLCNQEITYLHRYYYKCDQCEYSVHKLCEELPKTLVHASHIKHTFALIQVDLYTNDCCICKSNFRYIQLSYYCSRCQLDLCLDCSMNELQCHTIYHPSHQHPLTPTNRTIYANCDAYQLVKFYPRCRVCNQTFIENCWIYKCDKCRYCTHADCAYSKGRIPLISFYNGEDDPISLYLPFSDHTYKMIKDTVFKETNERITTLNSHEHPLLLVDKSPIHINNNKVVCNACMIPIVENVTFYKCSYGCHFVLHVWCTRLPAELKDYKGHPQHSLFLLPQVGSKLKCHVCNDVWSGFAYSCAKCSYVVDVFCAFMLGKITHKSHPDHQLSRRVPKFKRDYCRVCLYGFTYENNTWLSCESCNFHLHLGCALLLPETIRHKYDKHPMTLCYKPVENHEVDYFCEVCEEALNPNASFYHCHECDQSLHTECAPLIPQTKAYIHAAARVPDPNINLGARYTS
ncbi:hypothetical protein R6Q57_019010 [Mikania cordata]